MAWMGKGMKARAGFFPRRDEILDLAGIPFEVANHKIDLGNGHSHVDLSFPPSFQRFPGSRLLWPGTGPTIKSYYRYRGPSGGGRSPAPLLLRCFILRWRKIHGYPFR